MFKIGDEILIKGRILVVDHTDKDYPYEVRIDEKGIENLWVSEDMIAESKTYPQGLADAWELARKILLDKEHGGFTTTELNAIFYTPYVTDVFEKYTYEEALAKIEACEREKEIKVGDVVSFSDETKALIVDEALEDTVFVLTENGCIEKWERKALKKTNKKISISDLLRQIGE